MRLKNLAFSLVATVLIAFLALTAGCSDPAKDKEVHFKKAMIYLDEDKPEAAIIELRNAIQIDPKFADARYQLGLLYLKSGDPRQAFGELQRAATLDPDNLDAKVKTAEFYLLSQQKEDSRRLIEEILGQDPENIDGLALAANLELLDNSPEQALSNIDKAIALAPTEDRLYTIKGRVLAVAKKAPAAEAAFIKALDLNDQKQGNYITLVSFYLSQKQLDKAKSTLTRMAAAFPESPQPYLQMANLALRNNDLAGAEQDLLKAMEIAPKDIGLKASVAEFYAKQKKDSQAEQLYTEAIAASESPENIKAKLADFYFSRGKFEQARKLMAEILATNPKNGGAKLVQAKFLLKEGKPAEALEIADKLSNDYPRWDETFFVKAIAHSNLKQTDLAKNALLETISRNQTHAKARSMLALLFLQEGNFEEAKKEAATALKLDQKNFQAAMILAKSVLFSKDFENAQKMFSELDTKVPDNVEILGSLGLAYLGLKQPDKARDAFERVLAVQPGNAKAFGFVLKLAQQAGSDRQALITMTRKQLDKAPESGALQILFANLLLSSNQPEEALAAYRKAQALAPENPQSYAMSALILIRQGKTEQAIAEYKELLSRQPDAVSAHMGLGTIYEQTGQLELARESYRKILTINPNFAPAANNLAWLIAESPEPDLGEALRLAMIAKQEQPNNAHIIDTLGWVHYKRKSFSLARNEFSQAVEQDKGNPILRYHLALALQGEGKQEEAIQQLEQALTQKQSFPERAEAQRLLHEWKL
ncbi:tetratricopeptide repeat protein [Desulfogranum mediterraneum]|uniref:tetratricopeptide repeat protein n=1 Tax=Desulfogranum mediterraneum TaxID=160661 RepID=UPI00041E21C1|nr:tetratricopeptide repeat protein [Desulfogranum mediterraneum]